MRAAGAALLLCLAVGASGCGYALVGKGVSVDPTIKRIGVPLFKDRSGKPGLDQRITKDVIEELLKRGRFAVVQEPTGVDALVDGELVGYTVTPIAFEGGSQDATQATRYAITLSARVRYTKTGADVPLWQSDAFSYRDDYDLGGADNFFDREDQALERLSKAFARQLVSSMLEAF